MAELEVVPEEPDSGCICHGNWRLIIEDHEPLFDSIYLDENDERHIFSGVLWASDDFYYVMRHVETGKAHLLTCVGRIEDMGFRPEPRGDSDASR